MQRATMNFSVLALAAAASVTLALTLSMAGLARHYAQSGVDSRTAFAAEPHVGAATQVAIVPMRIEVVGTRAQEVAANRPHAQSI